MYPRIHLLGTIAVAVASIATASGCAYMQPQTSRQLDRSQSVFAASLSVPGTSGLIPRGSAQVMDGVGHGDLSAHVGTSGLQWGGAASVRDCI